MIVTSSMVTSAMNAAEGIVQPSKEEMRAILEAALSTIDSELDRAIQSIGSANRDSGATATYCERKKKL